MPKWIIPTSNGNGRAVITAEPGQPVDLAIERLYADERTQFDQAAVDDLCRKLAFALGIAVSEPPDGPSS